MRMVTCGAFLYLICTQDAALLWLFHQSTPSNFQIGPSFPPLDSISHQFRFKKINNKQHRASGKGEHAAVCIRSTKHLFVCLVEKLKQVCVYFHKHFFLFIKWWWPERKKMETCHFHKHFSSTTLHLIVIATQDFFYTVHAACLVLLWLCFSARCCY